MQEKITINMNVVEKLHEIKNNKEVRWLIKKI